MGSITLYLALDEKLGDECCEAGAGEDERDFSGDGRISSLNLERMEHCVQLFVELTRNS
jgi:hypothetical protein